MDYIKSLTGIMEKDYKTLMNIDVPYLDFIGNPTNIKTGQEIKFIKDCYDSHKRCFKGFYVNEVLNSLGAIISLPPSIDDYFKLIGNKSRNMVRKALKNNFTIHKITDYNKYLDDIYSINTSKYFRQSKPMTSGYLKKPTKIMNYISDNKHYNLIRYGCFIDNKLVAYCNPYIVNNSLIINQILGHGDYLKYGIMNLLIYEICNDMINNFKNVKYFLYINWFSGDNSLQSFKKSMGFYPKLVRLKNIYSTNLLPDSLTNWTSSKSINCVNNTLEVLNNDEVTPGISINIPIHEGCVYLYRLFFTSSDTSQQVILFGRDVHSKKQTFKKYIMGNDYVFFRAPYNYKNIELNVLINEPDTNNSIFIKKIDLFIVS